MLAYHTDLKTLRKLMIDKGILTITELAQVSGVDRNTLSSIFNEKTQPSSAVMYKLAESLNMSPTVAGDIFFAS